MAKLVEEGVLSKTGRDSYAINKQRVALSSPAHFLIAPKVSVSDG